MSRQLPTGTVAFLFTDIEGSTRLLQAFGDRYEQLLTDHARIVRNAFALHRGSEVGTEGDSFFVVFPSAIDAVSAAAEVQRDLATHAWPPGGAVRVRIGVHTGEGRLAGGGYVGLDVHRAARIAAAAHGGQVLLSEATRAIAGQRLPPGTALVALGRHRLKDLDEPEELYQLAIEDLRTEFPPPRSVDARPTNLPAALTSFVGREPEVTDGLRLLGEARLLTLTGPGGTGKTRLSLEIARRALDRFGDGAFFVPLDAIRDPALVASTVATVLGVEERRRTADKALAEHLASKELLLLLDNFEQVVEAAPVVDGLLAAAPRLTVVVTSRIPLRLYGEQEYPVGPLSLPGADAAKDPVALSQYDAVALFIERARAVSPGFAVTNDNARAVAEICVRLDGLPLAIELAAARVKLLSPEAILARLGHRLELLFSQSPNVPPRQRSLRGTIEWSWELLPEPEQRLFERLSVFTGSWDLPGAEAVCDPGELGISLLDGHASLLDKSLIRRTDDPEPRFMMLQTVQEYGWERLSKRGEATAIGQRHATYFRQLAEEAEPEFVGPDPARCVRRLLPDHDNLRAALSWALQAGDAETGVRLGSAIWRFWQERGQLKEGRHRLEQLLALPGASGSTPLRARALTAAAGIAYWQGDETARRYYEEALTIYRSLDDQQGIADSLQNLAFTVMGANWQESVRLFRESLARYRALGDERNIASVTGALGYGELMAGRHDLARAAVEEALELNTAQGRRGRASDNRFTLGHIHRLMGDLATAAAYYRASLLDAREMIDAARMLMQLRAISSYAVAVGRYEDALRLAGAIGRAREEQGGTISVPLPGVTDAAEEVRRLAAMGEEQIGEALGEGRDMDLEAAVDLGLKVLADGERQSATPVSAGGSARSAGPN